MLMKSNIVFVALILISPVGGFSEESQCVDVSGCATVSGDFINLRESPSVKAKSFGLLLQGTPVSLIKRTAEINEINGMKDYWYFCSTMPLGVEGWIFGKFIQSTGDKFVWQGVKYEEQYNKSLYPEEFQVILRSRWTSTEPSQRGKFDGATPGLVIEKNIIYDPDQYMAGIIYLVEKVVQTEKNKFMLGLRLVSSADCIKDKSEINASLLVEYNHNDDTINVKWLKKTKSVKYKLYRE